MTRRTQASEQAATMIGVDLGGTRVRVARVASDGSVLDVRRRATDRAGGPEGVILQIEEMARELLTPSCIAIGVGVPGTIDRKAGIVRNIPALPGWAAIPLADRLRSTLALPCTLENDAKAAALGEWHAGAAKGLNDFVYVTISTGIGGAAVVDGRLLRGVEGLAGEVGHTRISDASLPCACGLTGCWQSVASGAALDAHARNLAVRDPGSIVGKLAGTSPASGAHIGQAARMGDPAACQILKEHAKLLGYGMANLQHSYAPEAIVLGGGVSTLLDLMKDDLERTIKARLLPGFRPAALVPAALADDAGLVGATFREFNNFQKETMAP